MTIKFAPGDINLFAAGLSFAFFIVSAAKGSSAWLVIVNLVLAIMNLAFFIKFREV